MRALVVGSGPNGLVAALRLAEAGLDVTVLEAAQGPGGGLTSGEDTLPGFLHDRCAAFFPLTLASPVFRDLDLGLDWVNPDVSMAHPFEDGTGIALHRDLDATAASLSAAAPGAGEAWRAFVGPLLASRGPLVRTVLSRFPPLGAGLRLVAGLGVRDALDLGRRALGSAVTLGRDLFGHERPTAWLCGSATHPDLSPGAAGSAGFGLGLNVLGHLVGWGYPRGGAAALAGSLLDRLTVAGGRVRCGARVAEIATRDGRVSGAVLAGGEEVPAGAVVSTATAGVLAGMLRDGALPDRAVSRLRSWRYGIGTFKADFALSAPVPWAYEEARRAAVVHVGGGVDAFFDAAQEAGAGRVPREPTMVVGQQSLGDPGRAPGGRHTLYAYCHVPQRPDVGDEEIADRMEQRIEAFAPGFRELVLARSLRSPATLERENPNLVGGDLGGGSVELDQQLVFRPAPELCRGRTPLRGLYVAGSSVHPGPGVHGVSGDGAARALLMDRRLGRLRP